MVFARCRVIHLPGVIEGWADEQIWEEVINLDHIVRIFPARDGTSTIAETDVYQADSILLDHSLDELTALLGGADLASRVGDEVKDQGERQGSHPQAKH